MKKVFTVFQLDRQREIYAGDNSYWTLGDRIAVFDTEKQAESFIKQLEIGKCDLITILPIWETDE